MNRKCVKPSFERMNKSGYIGLWTRFEDILDNIIIEGKVHKLYDYPLEKNTELAKKLREILPEKVTLDGKVWEHTYTTSCSREYVATWEIADNKLFLRKILYDVGYMI